jgi:hypothetical protein
MTPILIYREDFKVALEKRDGDWVVPSIRESDTGVIKQYIKDLLGFTIAVNREHEDIIVAKRVFGDLKSKTRWVNLEEASKAFGKNSQDLEKLIKKDVDYTSKKQLLLIKKVFKEFEKEDLEIYLGGGWAVDFLTGYVSRPHVDIDTFIWKKDKKKISEKMKKLGFLIKDKERKFQNSLDGFQFDMDFVEQVDNGFVSGKSSNHEGINWPKETFEKPITGRLEDVEARVINPKPLYEFLKLKLASKLKQVRGSGPVEKTRQDILALERYLDG